MSREEEKAPKPTIKVYICDKLKTHSFDEAGILKEVLSGIEEESVPSETVYLPGDNAVELAFAAANEAVLAVGIGLDSKGRLAVHYDKLPPDEPLFELNYHSQKEKLRPVCSNAARLIKGTPFIILQ